MGRPGKKTAFQGRAKQILIKLADNGSLNTGQLVEAVGIQQKAISGYLKPLRDEGFVKSERQEYGFRYQETLMELFKRNSLTNGDLAAAIKGVDEIFVSTSLRKYRKLGYVERYQSDRDKRVWYYSLTDQGREFIEKGIGKHYAGKDRRYSIHSLTAQGRAYLDSLTEDSPAHEDKNYSSEEVDREFGKPELTGDEVNLEDWKKAKEIEADKVDGERRKSEEKERLSDLGIQENEDGEFSF